MLCGYTDTKLLEAQGVNIWKGNTSREFLDNLGLKDCPEGDLQFGYGHQIRHSGSLVNGEGGIDQLTRIENLLRHDPFSRRILWSLWSPINLKDCPLNPCHLFFQLYVESIGEDKYLSGHLVMRSNDIACGNPFNIFSYSVLIYILSKRTGMYPKNLIVSLSDAHIYSNHLNDITSQIKRTIRSSPVLYVSDEVINKSYEEMTIDDFDVIGYYPHPTIAYKMAV
jgi:thymidylate synthase